MLIIDAKKRLYSALAASSLEIEDFFSAFQAMEPQEFMRIGLEERKDVVLIDIEALQTTPFNDELLARLNTFSAIVAFMPTQASSQTQDYLLKLADATDKVVATYDMTPNSQSLSQLRSLLLMFWRQSLERERFKEQMVRFSQEMDELIRSAHQDIHKAKKIHEDVVPKRMEELKGITLFSKYAVGEGAGSEYFDVIRGAFHTHLVFLHTNSYLASSCLMGLLNKFKDAPEGLDVDLFLQEASMEIKALNAHKKKPIAVELLLMRMEHGNFKCDGVSFGSFELFSQNNGFIPKGTVKEFNIDKIDRARFSLQLDKGEKVVVFSPGFIFNWDEKQQGMTREAFIEANPRLTCPELLMEFFFRLKKQSSGDFLSKDATAVMMEVSRHAIKQV
mgnify:FL=1